MKLLLPLLFAVVLFSCSQSQEQKSASDSTVVGVWEAPDPKLYTDVSIYTKEGKVFLFERFFDGSSGSEEMTPDTLATGIKLTFKNGGYAEEYLLIDKDKRLRRFSSNDRQISITDLK